MSETRNLTFDLAPHRSPAGDAEEIIKSSKGYKKLGNREGTCSVESKVSWPGVLFLCRVLSCSTCLRIHVLHSKHRQPESQTPASMHPCEDNSNHPMAKDLPRSVKPCEDRPGFAISQDIISEGDLLTPAAPPTPKASGLEGDAIYIYNIT